MRPGSAAAASAAAAAGRQPGFSFFVPHSWHPAKAPSDCQIAQCFGHGNQHTRTTSSPSVPLRGDTDCSSPSTVGAGIGGQQEGDKWRRGRLWQRKSGQGNWVQEKKRETGRPGMAFFWKVKPFLAGWGASWVLSWARSSRQSRLVHSGDLLS